MHKISPCLWFERANAEEAVNFYVDTFRNARITEIMRHTESSPGPVGSVLAILFELEGEAFLALNGGSEFKFTPAISMFIKCDTQEEIDHYWDKLSAGGKIQQCGWLKDRYGLSWQIVPALLATQMRNGDPARLNRVMKEVLASVKLDIAKLQAAYG